MGQNIHVFITYFKKLFWIYHLICSNSFSKSHEFCNLSAIFLLSGKNIQLQVHVKSIYHWNVHNSTFFRNFGPTKDTSKWDRDLNIWQFMYQPHKQKLKEVHIKVFKVCYKFSIILICKHVTIENRHPVITGTKCFFFKLAIGNLIQCSTDIPSQWWVLQPLKRWPQWPWQQWSLDAQHAEPWLH